jgi:hypothetical protein
MAFRRSNWRNARRYFVIIGCRTGKRYRIRGNGANIIELDDAVLLRGLVLRAARFSGRGRRHAGPKDCPGNGRAALAVANNFNLASQTS